MKRPTLTVLACAAAAAIALALGTNQEAQAHLAARASQDAAESEQPSIDALAWMSGSWQGSGLGGSVEEHWSQPSGGTLIGMFRLTQSESTDFTQFMLVEAEEDRRVLLRFKHFNAGFEPWEKEGPLTFVLTQARPGLAVFESPDPKQTPLRLSYSTRGPDEMSAVIESPEGLGGPISFELLFKRGPAAE